MKDYCGQENWKKRLTDLLPTESISEQHATIVAHGFFVQEVYPRMRKLYDTLGRSNYKAHLQPSVPPTPDTMCRLDRITLSISRAGESKEPQVPQAQLEFAYREELIIDTTMRTREGRINQACFTLTGEPITHVEADIRRFAQNLEIEWD